MPNSLAAVIFTYYPRFIKILDSVLHHLVPAWDHTLGTFSEIKVRLAYIVLVCAVDFPFLFIYFSFVSRKFLRPILGLDLYWFWEPGRNPDTNG
jgi:hypothetical protein